MEIYWAPEVDPATVVIAIDLPYPSGSSPDFEIQSRRADADSVSAVFRIGKEVVRLQIPHGAEGGRPLAAVVGLGADGLDRIEAVERFWRALHRRALPADRGLTVQQRRRMRFMFQATDGRLAGASYRQIAAAIYGASRVAADAWKTSALRDSTIGLVKDGVAMIEGGYRKLLVRRRRK